MKRIHLLVLMSLVALGLTGAVVTGLLGKDAAVFLFVGIGLVAFMGSWRLEG